MERPRAGRSPGAVRGSKALFNRLLDEGAAGQFAAERREIAAQNKAIFRAQKAKLYWTHSDTEIAAAVEQAGFEIMSQKTVYRGYSDLLLCRAAA